MPKKDVEIDEKKRIFSLFILFFPSLLIAIIPADLGVWYLPTIIKALIAFYQFVVIKNFIDTYYGIT